MFLKDNTFGEYSIINMNFGKFNLDNTDELDYRFEDAEDAKKKDTLRAELMQRYNL